MKDGAVIETVFAFLAPDGMSPLALALGEVNEVADRFGCFFFKQPADDGSFAGFKGGIECRVDGSWNPFVLSLVDFLVFEQIASACCR